MQPRSPVRTNIVIFTILGFVVALLIHFIVLSSPAYNWLSNANGGALLLSAVRMLFGV
ncbi:light-harvesting protein [Chloroflexus sp. MS-G]|jgi:light-harvesting complex 1 alpha chain|uniref:light-harvesting protein n=1 Tax=Chloroflexus sp. MS-G TaxID=1521187 RepID=UPI0004DF4B96|nr:light-harvesting protein [Chloroflexus sp. MS-G]